MDLTSSGKLEHLSASVQDKYETKGFLHLNHKNTQAGFLSSSVLFVLTNLHLLAVWVDHYACHKAFFGTQRLKDQVPRSLKQKRMRKM